MRRKLRLNRVLFVGAGLIALVLTFTRGTPSNLVPFGMTEQVAQATPGQTRTKKKKHNLTGLQVFNRTLVRVQDKYVEPSRIDPKEMLYAAVDSVQFNIPEVLVEANKPKGEIKVVVNDKKAVFSTSEVNSTWRLAGQLKQIFRFIEANMNPGADLAQVEYAAVNGMLGTLDPHSLLLDPEMAREMDVNTSGKFGGLGIVIGMRKRKLTVIRPMKGTPAYAAGVKANDHIVQIDDEVTENLTLNESVDRMRGDPGTSVVLQIRRGKEKGTKRYQITRDIIRVSSVDSKMLSKGVGYIKIKQFAGNTAREVRQAMKTLRKQGAKGWVLDLRWNPGGLLEQAIQVSDLFVDAGTIVTTIGGGEREARSAGRRDSDTSSPVAVLVNGNSASASEIVAGALKQLNRAIIVGSTTFGKGSVQILYDNSDGSKLKLTIAQYLTPGNRSIQSLGITPDIELQRMHVPKQNKKPSDFLRMLPPSRSYREKDLKAHLSSKYAKNGDKPAKTLPFLYEPPKGLETDDEDTLEDGVPEEEPLTDEIVEDFEIRLGRDLVAFAGANEAQAMVKKSGKLLAKRREAEVQKLSGALKSLGVDWSEGKDETPPSLTANFAIQGGKTSVKAGDTVKLVGTVKNTGSTPAYRVLARIKSDDRVFDDTEFAFGKIMPGQTQKWTSHVKVPKAALDRLDYLNFRLKDQSGTTHAASPLKVRILSSKRPVFSYSHQLIDDGNQDGLVQPGESYRLRVTVKNTGTGVAGETTAILRNASGNDMKIKTARYELEALKPGQEKTVEFAFKSADIVRDPELVVELSVYDSTLRESVGEKLKYPVSVKTGGPTATRGSATVTSKNALLYEGTSTESATVGLAKRGSSFKVTGKKGEWLRVQLGKKRPAFLHQSAIRRGKQRAANNRFTPIWQVTPPKLNLSVAKMETDSKLYRLEGSVTDDTRVEDVYIFVSNRDAEVENRKVFYRSNRAGKDKSKMSFSTDIPLWPGSNLVTVVARENDEVRSSKTLYLFQKGQKVATPKAP